MERPEHMCCLVTGGLGYAGAWISSHLAAQSHEVHILSRKGEKKDIGQPYTLIQADLSECDPDDLGALLPDRLDCVIHAASCNEAFEPGYARKALAVNALGTRNLLQALVSRYGGGDKASPLPLVIYLSTFHVYGRSTGHILESDPAAPRNDYALTHYFGEEYCRMMSRLFGLPCIILRISNCYGAPKTGDSDKWYLLLNDLCKKAALQGEVPLQSNPATLRDFVWMGDLAGVTEKLIYRRDLAGKLFNVASGKAVSIGDVADLVAATASTFFHRSIPVVFGGGAGQEAADGTPSLCISNEALCSTLDFSFQDAMQDEIRKLLAMASGRGSGQA